MSREEREALLDAETPDLPDRTSPYRAGARRLAGIVIVSLVISAAVSLALILTLTAGLRDRVQREVLDELRARRDAAKVELPKEAVLVYVPADVSIPLPAVLAAHAQLAASEAVLEAAIADPSVADGAWYAANADKAVAALRKALVVTLRSDARLLFFHGERLPETEREAILSAVAKAYVERCAAKALAVNEARVKEIETQLAAAREKLRVLGLHASESQEKVDVDLAVDLVRLKIWKRLTQADAWTKELASLRGAVIPADQIESIGRFPVTIAKTRVQERERKVELAPERREAALLSMAEYRLQQQRVFHWTRRRYAAAADGGLADPVLPCLLNSGLLTDPTSDESHWRTAARLAALQAERARLLSLSHTIRVERKEVLEMVRGVPFPDTSACLKAIVQQTEMAARLEGRLWCIVARTKVLEAVTSRPASQPASRPSQPDEREVLELAAAKKFEEQVHAEFWAAKAKAGVHVEQLRTLWQERWKRQRRRTEGEKTLRLINTTKDRIDELDAEIQTLAAQLKTPS